jgi:hypothetical protein
VEGVLVQKLGAVRRHSERAARNPLIILEIEQVAPQRVFVELIGRPAIVTGQLPHCANVGCLGLFGQAAQLHVLDHALSQDSHD